MKKLIIAAAIVCAAAMSQASIVKWGTTSAVQLNGTKLGNQAVQLYMVGIADANDVLIDTRNTANTPASNKGKLSSGTGSGQSAYDYNSTIAGGDIWSSESGDLGRQYYIVITATGSDDKVYTYTSSAVTSSGLSDKALAEISFAFTDTIKTSGTDGWVASSSVPEPTSGLLLLLGMAGLALRRKQA